MEWSQLNIPIHAQPLFVMLDFDGTLVPIQEHASQCYLDPAHGQLLQELHDTLGMIVGIISGRSLADLKPRVKVPNLSYAGNHGLEIETGDRIFLEPQADACRDELNLIVNHLASILKTHEGTWIEHKGLSATVHYRQATPQTMEAVKKLLEPLQGNSSFVLREGKCIIEIRPRTYWHKGHAIQWLVKQFTSPSSQPHIIYIGDDHTDEDAFAMFTEHTTIRVGESAITHARHRVSTVDDVHSLLYWLRSLR